MEEAQQTQIQETNSLKFDDNVLVMIREIIQLSLLTGTNIIDHLRAIRVTNGQNGYITLTEEYVDQYNTYVSNLNETAEKQAELRRTTEANIDA